MTSNILITVDTERLTSLATLVNERSSRSLSITKAQRRIVILWYLGKKELVSKNLLPQCLHRYLRFRKTILTSFPKAGISLITCSR